MTQVSVPVMVQCDKCGHVMTNKRVVVTQNQLVPLTCSGIEPKGHATIYEITTSQIQDYLQEKIKSYNPDAQIMVNPMYTEPNQREWEIHRAYAVINVAFSANLIEDPMIKQGAPDWLIKGLGRTKVVQSVADEVIKRYRLNAEDFNRDYRHAEQNAHQFGITNTFAETVKMLIEPKSVTTNGGSIWVVVALSAAKIIADMLSSQETKKLEGKLFIQDVRKVSNNMVTFSVIVMDGASTVTKSDNPNITALLESILKGKR